MTLQIELSDVNKRKLDELALRTGRTPDELLNEAVEKLPVSEASESQNRDWRIAWQRVAGIWKDREDLPDFEEVRRSWDRDLQQGRSDD